MAVVAAAVAGGRGLLESAAGDSGGYTKPVCACFVDASSELSGSLVACHLRRRQPGAVALQMRAA